MKYSWLYSLITVIILAASAYFLYALYSGEERIWPGGLTDRLRRIVPDPIYFLLMITGSIPFFLSAYNGCNDKKRSAVRFSECVLLVVLMGFFNYSPFPAGSAWHHHAYINSIISTAQFRPYDDFSTSTYGHYGILYLPIVRLFGNNMQAISVSIAMMGILGFVATFFVLSRWIENDLVFLWGCLAACGLHTCVGNGGGYWQREPHRVLFPILGLLYITWSLQNRKQKQEKKLKIMGVTLASLAIVWNIETGVVTAITVAFFWFIISTKTSFVEWLRAFICSIVYVTLCICGACMIINLYNLLTPAHELLSVRNFFIPIIGWTGYVNNLRYNLPSVFSMYFLQIIFFSIVIIRILPRIFTFLPNEDSEDYSRNQKVFLACAGVCGLGVLTYFMNRSVWGNIKVSWVEMSIVLACLADGILSKMQSKDMQVSWKEMIKTHRILSSGVFLVVMFILFSLGTETVLGLENAVTFHKDKVTTVQFGWDKMKEEISASVPKDTVAFGVGLPEMYFSLGWDTQLIMRGFLVQ